MLYKILCRGTMRDKKYIAAFVGASCLIVVWTISAAAAWSSGCATYTLVCSHGVSGRAEDVPMHVTKLQ